MLERDGSSRRAVELALNSYILGSPSIASSKRRLVLNFIATARFICYISLRFSRYQYICHCTLQYYNHCSRTVYYACTQSLLLRQRFLRRYLLLLRNPNVPYLLHPLPYIISAEKSSNPASSSYLPSSAVASWYCWYSDTRSFMLDSASVNSISSMPSPVYQ